jgi:hypothetical protein
MRKIALAVIAISFATTAKSQRLIVHPQAGINTFSTEVRGNTASVGYQRYTNASPTVGARLYYTSRKGHGPYVGINLSDAGFVSYDGIGERTTQISILRYEAGYHWLTKPFYFKRIWDNGLSAEEFKSLGKKGLSVQLQPNAGLFVANNRSVGITNNNFGNILYKDVSHAGNIGLNGGLNFLFSNNDKPLFTLSIQYFKGFGQLYSGSIISGNNTVSHSSKGSGFQFTLGIPITVFRKKKN